MGRSRSRSASPSRKATLSGRTSEPSEPARFLFFGGKGGVGKTTLAAAAALAAAESGGRVLVVSTDPAHSLGDALGTRLGPHPSRLTTRRGALHAAEIDAPRAFSRWLDDHREPIRTLAERGTLLDAADLDRLLALPAPGVDELVGLLEATRLAGDGGFDRVVIDTAPTAHTLRLLAMPEALARFAALLGAMRDRHRAVAEQLAGGWRPDAADAVAGEVDREARELGELVRDRRLAELRWVLLAEALAVEETVDAVAALAEAGVAVGRLVVNRVTPEPAGPGADRCAACRARRRAEAVALADLRARLPGLPVAIVPELDREPRGVAGLRRVARGLEAEAGPEPEGAGEEPTGGAGIEAGAEPGRTAVAAGEAGGSGVAAEGRGAAAGAAAAGGSRQSRPTQPPDSCSPTPDASRREGQRAVPASPADGESGRLPAPPGWIDELAPPGLALLFVAGKGGVGKSTCAAALALAAARKRPDRRVELLSIDPAHSLADVLGLGGGQPGGATIAGHDRLPPNIEVRELDAAAVFAARRDQLREALDELWTAAGDRRAGADATLDRRILERLIEGIPPGLDELVAMIELTAAIQSAEGPGPASLQLPPDPQTPARSARPPRPASAPSAPSRSPSPSDSATPARPPRPQGNGRRLVVVDTAPTGHLLRLLETPELALAWSRALMEVLLRYRRITGLGRLARELIELSRGTRALEAALADPARTRFAVVTRAAELPRRETVRLLGALGRRRVAVAALVVDAVRPTAAGGRSGREGSESCPRCAARAAAQTRQLDRLRRAAAQLVRQRRPPEGGPRCAILLAPAAWPPPIGVAALIRWSRRWRREDPPIENPPSRSTEMD